MKPQERIRIRITREQGRVQKDPRAVIEAWGRDTEEALAWLNKKMNRKTTN